MKANKVFTIALATVCCATIMSVGNAFGAEETKETVYPQNFDCTLGVDDPKFDTPIRDFAVHGENFAVAHSNFVYTLFPDGDSGERQMLKYEHHSGISAIDYDEKGKLYFKDATDISYTLTFSSERPVTEPAQYEFKDASGVLPLMVNQNAYYTLNSENELTFVENKYSYVIGTGYTLLKQCGDAIYTVKENCPYLLEGSIEKSREDLLKYTNFAGAKRIYTGDAKEKLAQFNENLITDEIKEGAFYTKLVDSELGERFQTDVTTRAKINTTCMVLCTSGNASIVAIKDDFYITATDNLIRSSEMQSYSDEKFYHTLTEINVYSTPFMSESTKLTLNGEKVSLAAGAKVKVIERYEHSVLGVNYCKISFEENGQTVKGYVAANYLSAYGFAAEDNKPAQSGDDPVYDTNVVSVIIAIVIVALVIIAALYIALVWSKKDKNTENKKPKKEKEKKSRKEDDDETDDEE